MKIWDVKTVKTAFKSQAEGRANREKKIKQIELRRKMKVIENEMKIITTELKEL